jgi:hypothetical protein
MTTPVERQFVAYNNRDIEAFANCFAKDVQVFSLNQKKLLMDGREAFKAYYKDLFEKSPHLNARLINRSTFSNFVTDQEEVTGRAGVARLSAIAIYEVKNDLIQNVWFISEAFSS